MAPRQVELCKDVHEIRYAATDLEVIEGKIVNEARANCNWFVVRYITDTLKQRSAC